MTPFETFIKRFLEQTPDAAADPSWIADEALAQGLFNEDEADQAYELIVQICNRRGVII